MSTLVPGVKTATNTPAAARVPVREDTRPTATSGTIARPSAALATDSPTSSVGTMLLAVAIALLLGLLLNARAIVRDTAEMQDGPIRSVLLAVSEPALRLAEGTHLTWPRDRLDAALGHAPQPSLPPLLAGAPLALAVDPLPGKTPAKTTPTPPPTATAVRRRLLAQPTPGAPAPHRVPSGWGIRYPDTPTISPPTPIQRIVRVWQRGEAVPAVTTLPGVETPAKKQLERQHTDPESYAAPPSRPPAATGTPPARRTPVVPRASTPAGVKTLPGIKTPARPPAPRQPVRRLPSHTQTHSPGAGRIARSRSSTTRAVSHTGAQDGPRSAHPRYRGFKSSPTSLPHRAGRQDQPPARTSPHTAPAPTSRLRRPTAGHPLRLLVTGDSLTGYLGPALIDKAAAVAPIVGFVDTHNGTGLTRPDFVDWSLVAQQQVASDNPDVVVVMLGGNDFQNMTLPGGQFFIAGTPAWTREYQRRAAICMRIWTLGGTRRVYWLSMPPARDPNWANDDKQINIALRRAAAQVQGATYLDVLGPVTAHGNYTDFVPDGHGQPILVREADGVHLNQTGSAIVADEVLHVFERQWSTRG